MTQSPAPKLAATVVLLRDAPKGPEAYLVRRGSRAAFMPDLHVYPGGRVDAGDADLVAQLHGTAPEGAPQGHGPSSLVAAIRELFEEAGVLLVAGSLPERRVVDRARAALNAGTGSLAAFLLEAGLTLDARGMVAFDHWITPDFESRRYDTAFYLARMPEGQDAREDEAEVYDGAWWRPAALLEAYRARTLALAPPTFATLDWLAEHRTVADAFAAAHARRVVPILPRMAEDTACPTLLLPGDPLYPSARPCAPPTRIEHVDGLWQWGLE